MEAGAGPDGFAAAGALAGATAAGDAAGDEAGEATGEAAGDVVAGLRRERTHADAVLHDQHSVAVEAANDRTRAAGAETALGDTRTDAVR